MCLGLFIKFFFVFFRNALKFIFDMRIVSIGSVKLSFSQISALVIHPWLSTMYNNIFLKIHIIYLTKAWPTMI